MSATSHITGQNEQAVAANDASTNNEYNEVVGGVSALDISRGNSEARPATPARTTPGIFKDSGFGGSDGLITPEKVYTDYILFEDVKGQHAGNLFADTRSSAGDNHGYSTQEDDEISLEMKDIGFYCESGTYSMGYEQASHNLQEAYKYLATNVDDIYKVADNSDAQSFYDHTALDNSFVNSITTWVSTSHRHESLLYRTEYPTYPPRDFQVPQSGKKQRRASRISRSL
jgi:hypothetical protein